MLGNPPLRHPRGLMKPRGPSLLMVLLALTLGVMLYCGRAREVKMGVPGAAPSQRPDDEPASSEPASPDVTRNVTRDAG